MTSQAALGALRAFVYRHPIATPVVTSFGVMRDRPMLLVRAEDSEGAVGWGEVWCNFPAFGAEHRARVVEQVLAPLAVGQAADPAGIFRLLTERTAVLALQTGEPGPLAQAIAGVDIALWDLAARRAGLPLWRMLGARSPEVPVYASGLNPERPEELAARRFAEGHRAFKLKVGFGAARDAANLRALRQQLGAGATLMADANQAWTLEEALRVAPGLEDVGLAWLEEPLRADRDWEEWRRLAAALRTPLAGGENLAGEARFEAAIAAGALGVLQPDIGKWGGFTAGLPLARRILAAGRRFCPHWLGGGIGLLASAHLLAAAGGDGLLEVDANDNKLRSLTCDSLASVAEGRARLSEVPGLGAPPDQQSLREFLVPGG